MMLANVDPQPTDEPDEVIWTYDVAWEQSDIRWASRWDLYMYMGEDDVHWFSIINSLVVVLFLGGMVAMIMIRPVFDPFISANDFSHLSRSLLLSAHPAFASHCSARAALTDSLSLQGAQARHFNIQRH